MSEPIRQALILAGGRGTRLGAITEAIPKPMLRIAGDKPFLDYLIEMIERHGYEDILLLGGYLGEVLEAAYDGRRIGRAKLRVLREKAPLGTAGALTIARETLDPRFLMMNGDAFFDINLRALEQAALEGGAMATLALRSVRRRRALRAGDRGARQSRRVSGKGPEPAGPGNHQWRDLCAEARDPRPRFRPALLARTGRLSGAGRARPDSGQGVRRLFPRYRPARNARTGTSRAAERARAPRRLLRPAYAGWRAAAIPARFNGRRARSRPFAP